MAVSCNTINCSNAHIHVIITNHQNVIIMNKEQLSTLIKYCEFVFATTAVPVTKCLDVIELEADYYHLTINQFLDCLANGCIIKLC